MCQMQTTFFACAQLAEGKTTLCAKFQLTVGRSCDGISSFSRLLNVKCPKCQAGKPHPGSQDLDATIDSMACPGEISASVHVAAEPSPRTCNPVDEQTSPKAVASNPVSSTARVSAKGGIRKTGSEATRRSPRRIVAPTANMGQVLKAPVATMVASPACEQPLSPADPGV